MSVKEPKNTETYHRSYQDQIINFIRNNLDRCSINRNLPIVSKIKFYFVNDRMRGILLYTTNKYILFLCLNEMVSDLCIFSDGLNSSMALK